MPNRIYITGDTHGSFNRIEKWCSNHSELTRSDILIVLGDAGINYYLNDKDKALKDLISRLPITCVCVHGNHEERPSNISSYKKEYVEMLDCNCWVEGEYPNILFPEDGKMTVHGKRFLLLGGAYSVDKWIRKMYGWKWFESEQMTDDEMSRIMSIIETENEYDFILSHTCPKKFEPTHLFLKGLDQNCVDKRMETFLDKVEEKVNYQKWLFGHFHSDEVLNNNVRIVFNDIFQIV